MNWIRYKNCLYLLALVEDLGGRVEGPSSFGGSSPSCAVQGLGESFFCLEFFSFVFPEVLRRSDF